MIPGLCMALVETALSQFGLAQLLGLLDNKFPAGKLQAGGVYPISDKTFPFHTTVIY